LHMAKCLFIQIPPGTYGRSFISSCYICSSLFISCRCFCWVYCWSWSTGAAVQMIIILKFYCSYACCSTLHKGANVDSFSCWCKLSHYFYSSYIQIPPVLHEHLELGISY
jgi:hypothetical protein